MRGEPKERSQPEPGGLLNHIAKFVHYPRDDKKAVKRFY